jgi:hypothetical protein
MKARKKIYFLNEYITLSDAASRITEKSMECFCTPFDRNSTKICISKLHILILVNKVIHYIM